MKDDEIVALYLKRDEAAIRETENRFGRYLIQIAYNVLFDWEDSKECVNDTYLKAWNSIPPHKPECLSAYLAKITRQSSIDIFRRKNCEKRRASEYDVSLSELEECLSAGNMTEQDVDLNLLSSAINAFLRTCTDEVRDVFIGRYYFADSIREIARYCRMSEPKVKSMLWRTRAGLKSFLEKEGFE